MLESLCGVLLGELLEVVVRADHESLSGDAALLPPALLALPVPDLPRQMDVRDVLDEAVFDVVVVGSPRAAHLSLVGGEYVAYALSLGKAFLHDRRGRRQLLGRAVYPHPGRHFPVRGLFVGGLRVVEMIGVRAPVAV